MFYKTGKIQPNNLCNTGDVLENKFSKEICFPEICRTCLLVVNENSHKMCIDFIESNIEQTSIRNKLYLCCPSLDLHFVSKGIICISCVELLTTIYQFTRKYDSIQQQTITFSSIPNTYLIKNVTLDIKNEIKIEEPNFCNTQDPLQINKSDETQENEYKQLWHDTFTYIKEKPFIFLPCGYVNPWKSEVKRRMPSYSGENSLKYFEGDYWSGINIIKQQIHTGGKPFNFNQNNNSSTLKNDTLQHILSHIGKKTFKCLHCNYSSIQKGALKQHILTHTIKKPFNCFQCDYGSTRKNDLQRHMRIHTGEKPYKCPCCGYNSARNSDLKIHIRIHTGEKPFKCNHCDYSSTRRSTLQQHMYIHSGKKPFKCLECEYSSARKSDLHQHVNIHSGNKPHKCTCCSYRSSQKSALKQHMRLHTGEKPFKCTQCNYSAVRSSMLKLHVHIHTGEKPFKCFQCNYSSVQKRHLQRHLRIHTEQRPSYYNYNNIKNTIVK